jgi:catechol 2,3-dioxygenase-like lactoylglutathione lyase family enzyme
VQNVPWLAARLRACRSRHRGPHAARGTRKLELPRIAGNTLQRPSDVPTRRATDAMLDGGRRVVALDAGIRSCVIEVRRGGERTVSGRRMDGRALATLRCGARSPARRHRGQRSFPASRKSGMRHRRSVWPVFALLLGGAVAPARALAAQSTAAPPATPAAAMPAAAMPALHHVGLNSVDPERAIAWYLRVWPTATRTTVAGVPAIEADMFVMFHQVDRPPAGAWRHDLHRAEPQSAFWHIGAFTNTTDLAARLGPLGVFHLPLFTSPQDTVGVWRSGLAPYAGTLTAAQLATAPPAAPRDGGFSYVVAPDGVLFEFTGGPGTRDALAHVHLFHERPRCAARWYVEQLGMALPPARAGAPEEPPDAACDAAGTAEATPYGEAGWPSLEPVGTIRQPAAGVRLANGSLSWYPRQCVGTRCGRDQPLVPSRGQALDHVAFVVDGLDARLARLRRAGVTVLEGPYAFGPTRAAMIEGPDRLAIELVERRGAPLPRGGPE